MAAQRVQVSFWAGHQGLILTLAPERLTLPNSKQLGYSSHPQPWVWWVLTCPVSFGTCGGWRRAIAGVASKGCPARMESWCWPFQLAACRWNNLQNKRSYLLDKILDKYVIILSI